MGFKDQIKKDVKIFMNGEEFAETHFVDGRPMTIIIDKFALIERASKGGASNTDGIYTNSILIYVSVSDYGARPKVGKLLNLDGTKIYKITDVTEEDGIYSFEMEANRA